MDNWCNDSEIDVNINTGIGCFLCFIRAAKVASIHFQLTQIAGWGVLEWYLLLYPPISQTKTFYCLNIGTGFSKLRSLHYNNFVYICEYAVAGN